MPAVVCVERTDLAKPRSVAREIAGSVHDSNRWRATRHRHRAFIATLFVFCFALSPASAQLLDLGAPDPPAIADSGVEEQIARVVEAEIRRLTETHELGPRLEAAIAVRRFGLTLLASDLEAHPERFIPGVLLTERASELDRLIFDSAALVEPAAALLVRSLDIPTSDLPTDARGLDRLLRDALADLADAADIADPKGWPGPPGATPPETDRLDALAEAAPEACAPTASDLAQLLRLGLEHPAYRPSAMRSARALLAIEPVLSPPAWIEDRVEGLQARACEAIDALGDPELQHDALATLEELGRWARVIVAAERLDDGTEARLARRAIADAAERGVGSGELNAAVGAIELAVARHDLPHPRSLVRQLRPAWQRLEREARRTELELIAVIPGLLADAGAMDGGGVVAPMAAHRECIDDMRTLVQMSERIADPTRTGDEPTLSPRFGPLATEAVRAGNALRAGGDDGAARARLRELAEAARVAGEVRGEPFLRDRAESDTPESWRVGELLALLDAQRLEMLSARRAEDITARANPLLIIDELVWELSLLLLAQEPSAIEAWPGWTLRSGPARSLAINGAEEALGRTASDLLEGRDERAREAIDLYRQRFAFARLLGVMEQTAREIGLEDDPPASLLARLTAGSPDPARAWMAGERRTLAELCRYAAAMPQIADTRLEAEIRRHLNELALGVLERNAPR